VIRKTDDGKAQWCQSDERVFSFVQLVSNVPERVPKVGESSGCKIHVSLGRN